MSEETKNVNELEQHKKLDQLRIECPEPYGLMSDSRIIEILIDRELTLAVERGKDMKEEFERMQRQKPIPVEYPGDAAETKFRY